MNKYHNTMPISFMGCSNELLGGPFKTAPGDAFRIKMAKEIVAPCEVSIPTADFSVPKMDDMLRGVEKALPAILSGKPVFVGCMGGIGRTGLFLGCVSKLLHPGTDPVKYVRQHYKAHAIETVEQQNFVRSFPVEKLIWKARWIAIKCRVVKAFSK